ASFTRQPALPLAFLLSLAVWAGCLELRRRELGRLGRRMVAMGPGGGAVRARGADPRDRLRSGPSPPASAPKPAIRLRARPIAADDPNRRQPERPGRRDAR